MTTSYVLVEASALIQHRLGLDALRLFERDVRPVLEIEWLGQDDHERGIAAVLAAGHRRLSLVDCTSFETMRRLGVQRAFTFDAHFADQGFQTLTSYDQTGLEDHPNPMEPAGSHPARVRG